MIKKALNEIAVIEIIVIEIAGILGFSATVLHRWPWPLKPSRLLWGARDEGVGKR